MERATLAVALGMVVLAVGCGDANDSGETESKESGPQGISKDGHPDQLVGTWRITLEGANGTVTYKPDGTWDSTIDMKIEGKLQHLTSEGTWRVENGAIHNVTLKSSLPGFPTPYTSIEKLASLNDQEYRYVCPVAGTTNRMVKVVDDDLRPR